MSIRTVHFKQKDPGTPKQEVLSNLGAYLFVAPHAIGLFVFVIMPIAMTAILSVFDWISYQTPVLSD